MEDSVKGYRAVGNRSRELIESLNDLAHSLALSGRGDESLKPMDESEALARDLKNDSVQSALLNTRGDIAFYRGDFAAARVAYDQALRVAARAKDRDRTLIAKLGLAKVAVAEGRSQAALTDLRAITQQATGVTLKYFSLQSSVAMAQAMINTKDYAHARQELESDLGRSERLGTRMETAAIHYLLGDAIRLSGNASEASGQYRQALGILDALRKEQGAERLLDRSDLRKMFEEASHWASASSA
jgi:tetratricopeptide (TPR) repeat protein